LASLTTKAKCFTSLVRHRKGQARLKEGCAYFIVGNGQNISVWEDP